MKRFMGMMPSSEVEILKHYKDDFGLKLTIQASKSGWTVIYSDFSSDYEDCEDTAENNFSKAYKHSKDVLGCIKEIEGE